MILIIGFILFLYALDKRVPQITNYPNDRTEIIAFGDSLVEGVGSSTGGGFVDELEVILNIDITNLGVSGNTTRDALIRIDDVLDREAKMVIISLGGNDFIRRFPQEEVKRNFDKIISQIQNDGAMVMLLDVPGYGSLVRDLSGNHDAAYVSNILRGLIGRDRYMADAIHPNDEGYRKVAEKIAPELAKFIK